MDIVSTDSDVTRSIAACNEQMWQAYLEKNVVRHNAILSDDYTSIHPDGSLHSGPPSAATHRRIQIFAIPCLTACRGSRARNLHR
jgi:hypothetical protein